MKLQDITLTHPGRSATLERSFQNFYALWWDAYGRWPEIFRQVAERDLPLFSIPIDGLFEKMPSASRLLEHFSTVPTNWDQVRGQYYDLSLESKRATSASRLRLAHQEELDVWLVPFSGDPLSARMLRPVFAMLQLRPLTALDTLALAIHNTIVPYPLCAVDTTYLIANECYTLSCELDENDLTSLVFRREQYLPTQAWIPIYAR